MMDNLHEVMQLIEHGWSRVHALVVGDVMLDRYIWGKVERISPEAPVPVVRASHRSAQPGGAANVAMNLAGLGARVTLLGFAGGDSDQQALEELLEAAGVCSMLTRTSGIPTTSKLRILSGNQQMLRLDTESHAPRPADAYDELLGQFEKALPAAGVVILSDYAKGVLTERSVPLALSKDRVLPGSPCWSIPRAGASNTIAARPRSAPTCMSFHWPRKNLRRMWSGF